MLEYKLKVVTPEEYRKSLQDEIEMYGLTGSIKKRLDEIDEATTCLGYLQHRDVQEWCNEIVDLLKAFSDKKRRKRD